MRRSRLFACWPVAFGAPALVLGLNWLAIELGSYQRFAHLDSLMHVLGGFACGLLVLWWLWFGARCRWWQVGSTLPLALTAIGAVGLITIGWEVFELLLYASWQASIQDTVADEVLGVFGGALLVAGSDLGWLQKQAARSQ